MSLTLDIGIEKDYPEYYHYCLKEEKSKDICRRNIEYNKVILKRALIEHTTCRSKKYRILADVFRNRLKKYNKVSDIVSGLVNYRIMNCHN